MRDICPVCNKTVLKKYVTVIAEKPHIMFVHNKNSYEGKKIKFKEDEGCLLPIHYRFEYNGMDMMHVGDYLFVNGVLFALIGKEMRTEVVYISIYKKYS